jgi:tetratricopeptide (TPR) repeat protein
MESIMANIIDEIKSLKDLAQSQSGLGQYEIEAKTLRNGIDVLEAALTRWEGHGNSAHRASTPVDTEERRIAAELADLYGMLGGANRKQGDLMRAIATYDQGFRYESNPRYGIINTYNALNRLVTRILMCPGSLSDPDALRNVKELEFVDVPRTLNALRAELKQEVGGVRSHDFWAAGDLAFTCALTGDDQGALDALQRFESCSPLPPTSAYSAYIDWIGAVAQLDAPRKEALNKVKVLFENRMKSASGNVLA